MKRDGRAETGVTLSIILLFELLLFPLALDPCEGCVTGCGRAKGFGGPDAPADNKAEAEGEGGGSTIPPWSPPLRRAFWLVAPADRGDERSSAVADPPLSDASSGICTFNIGLLPPPTLSCALFVRDGGVNPSGKDDMDMLRFLLCVCDL